MAGVGRRAGRDPPSTHRADRRSSTASAPLGVADESQHATARRLAPHERMIAAECGQLLCLARYGGAIAIDEGDKFFRQIGEKLKSRGIQRLAQRLQQEGIAAVGATVPAGRLATPDDIGNCAAFLASPLAAYVSGSTLTVHGGGERPAYLAAARTKEAK